MKFVFVSDGVGRLEAKGFRRYLYGEQAVVVEITPTEFGEAAIISSEDSTLAENLRDRYSSGMFGSCIFETLEEAEAFLKTY